MKPPAWTLGFTRVTLPCPVCAQPIRSMKLRGHLALAHPDHYATLVAAGKYVDEVQERE